MESQKSKKLLQKYWEGKTNVAEEKQLKVLFESGIPKEERPYKLIFDYKSAVTSDESSFDLNFLDQVMEDKTEKPKKTLVIRQWQKSLVGVAAAVLVMIGSLWFQWDEIEQPTLVQEKNMNSAYEETLYALAFLAEKLNKGNASIMQLSAFDKTTKQVIDERN